MSFPRLFSFFFFNDTATTEIYTLSLHDALPISKVIALRFFMGEPLPPLASVARVSPTSRPHKKEDRKSTRLNSSHRCISYAVFCLKKKKKKTKQKNKTSKINTMSTLRNR